MLKSIWIENHGEARSGGPLLAYLGESGEVLSNLGNVTQAERKLSFGSHPPEGWSPSEQDVMAVASDWSFDPTQLNSSSGTAANGILARTK